MRQINIPIWPLEKGPKACFLLVSFGFVQIFHQMLNNQLIPSVSQEIRPGLPAPSGGVLLPREDAARVGKQGQDAVQGGDEGRKKGRSHPLLFYFNPSVCSVSA